MRRGQPIEHGVYKYVRDGCRCRTCGAANSARCRANRVRRYAQRAPGPDGRPVTTADVTHGAYSTYRNWGCRCAPCTEAHSIELRQRKAHLLTRGAR